MASPTQWRWVCVSSGSWWWTGRPGVLQSMGLQKVSHDWGAELIDWLIQTKPSTFHFAMLSLFKQTQKHLQQGLAPLWALVVLLCLVAQLCPTLCDPMDCSSSGSSIIGILQARILEWVAMPSSRATFQPRDRTQVSLIAGGFFTVWANREADSILTHWVSTIALWHQHLS